MTGDAVIAVRTPLTDVNVVAFEVIVAEEATDREEPVKLLRDGVGDGEGDLRGNCVLAVAAVGDPCVYDDRSPVVIEARVQSLIRTDGSEGLVAGVAIHEEWPPPVPLVLTAAGGGGGGGAPVNQDSSPYASPTKAHLCI